MRAIDGRHWLGLLLIGMGLMVAVIYYSQSNPPAPSTPSAPPTPRYYGPLVPTSLGRTTPTQQTAHVNDPTATEPPKVEVVSVAASATRTPFNTATRAGVTKIPTTQVATVASSATARATRTLLSTITRVAATKRPTTRAATSSASAVTRASATEPPTIPATTISPATATATTTSPQALTDLQRRLCIAVPYGSTLTAGLNELRPGWYLNWGVSARPARPSGVEFAQMVRVPEGQPAPNLQTLATIAQQNPGALWLVGNEMDVIWQDNATPEQYAVAYHDVYATLKQADPGSRVAIGGISLPSPLRLQYLDRVLQVYRDQYGQEMPVDVWNVHNFILPEQRGSWGVDIPPGFDATSGLTYGIDDHNRLDIFKQQLVDFRRWMAERGYRDRELLVTEYGILMPVDYGFDHARVRDFMLGSFEVMRTATDPGLGRPTDGNHLVQRWCWYSLADTTYPTGNLIDPATRNLTPLGRDFKQYIETHP